MTIIEPHKNKFSISYFPLVGFFLLAVAILSIYFYNSNINLKYKIRAQEKLSQQLEALNGDLKNQIYQIMEFNNVAEFALRQNLISDKNPDYLEYKSLANH